MIDANSKFVRIKNHTEHNCCVISLKVRTRLLFLKKVWTEHALLSCDIVIHYFCN